MKINPIIVFKLNKMKILIIIAMIGFCCSPSLAQNSIKMKNSNIEDLSELQILKKRNEIYAKSHQKGLAINPKFSTIILTCLDARVDPAHFLGLELGEVLVMRNPGGRVTPEVERDLAILWTLVAKVSGENFKGLSLAIIHHTDCGYERLANPEFQKGLNAKLGIDLETLDQLAIHDHSSAMDSDISKLKNSPVAPSGLNVTGLLYNLDNGKLTEIEPK